MTASICASSASRTVWPTAAISASASRSPSSATAALPTSAVMPRPTAAGVFGIARTIGVPAPSAASKARIGVPAAMDRNSVAAAAERREPRQRRAHHLRLDREHRDRRRRGEVGVQAQALGGERGQPRRGVRLEDGEGGGREAAGPASPRAARSPSCRSRAARGRVRRSAQESDQAASAPFPARPGKGAVGSGATVGFGHGDAKRLLRASRRPRRRAGTPGRTARTR